jgi:small subunit ribosomal protein S21
LVSANKILSFATLLKRYSRMLIVNVKENESIDKALKRFKKKFEKTGVVKELRKRSQFDKPSVVRRAEMIKAKYRQKMRDLEA